MAKWISLLCFVAGFGASAQDVIQGTGLFLEPGISYQVASGNVNYPAPMTNSAATHQGFGAIVRGGIHVFERFFVAADGRYALLNFEDNANAISVQARSWDIAPVIGMQMADWGGRAYVGYTLAGELDPESVHGFDYRFEQPQGWRAGFGLKMKMLSVNIEWQRLEYAKTQIQSAGTLPAGTTTAGKHAAEGLIASVTFPIQFN